MALRRLRKGGHLALLLRISMLGSTERATTLWAQPGLRYLSVIAPRPSFDDDGNDTSDVALFIWQEGYKGRAEILSPLLHEKTEEKPRKSKVKLGKLPAPADQDLADHQAALKRGEAMVVEGHSARGAAKLVGVTEDELLEYMEAGAKPAAPKAKRAAKPSSVVYCLAPKCMVREDLTQGLCRKHYAGSRGLDLAKACSVPACTETRHSGELCQEHLAAAESLNFACYDLKPGALQRIAEEAVRRAAKAPRKSKVKPKRPRQPIVRDAACIVPGCSRRAVSKKLCSSHYRKAGRLKFYDDLSAEQLRELAKDGRAA